MVALNGVSRIRLHSLTHHLPGIIRRESAFYENADARFHYLFVIFAQFS